MKSGFGRLERFLLKLRENNAGLNRFWKLFLFKTSKPRGVSSKSRYIPAQTEFIFIKL